MPWQGDSSVTIDRFDGRAHLDFIAEFKPAADAAANPTWHPADNGDPLLGHNLEK